MTRSSVGGVEGAAPDEAGRESPLASSAAAAPRGSRASSSTARFSSACSWGESYRVCICIVYSLYTVPIR